MSEFDELVEGYDSSLPKEDPGPLTDEENQALEELLVPGTLMQVLSEEIDEAAPIIAPKQVVELQILRPDKRPLVGVHYVVYNGIPRPVVRGNYAVSEDEHVRTNIGDFSDLHGDEGLRRIRADRTIRLRYRGYLCGEMSSL